MQDDRPIYHAALPLDWADAFRTGEYTVSTRGASLEEVGFIHASTREQIEGVANRFYADVDELVLLTIDPVAVPHEIRWEPPAPGTEERFPHIYGPLPVTAVVMTHPWFRSITGDGAGWHLDSLTR